MTLTEFKYWLEGYEESFELQRPNAVQWKKIKEKLDNVAVVKPPVMRESEKMIPPTGFPPFKVTY